MDRNRILALLNANKAHLFHKYEISRLGVFGSVARGESNQGSDIDIFVEMPPDIFKLVHAKEELESLLDARVDLIRNHKHLNPLLKSRIEQEVLYV